MFKPGDKIITMKPFIFKNEVKRQNQPIEPGHRGIVIKSTSVGTIVRLDNTEDNVVVALNNDILVLDNKISRLLYV